jgi:hypothetical protein
MPTQVPPSRLDSTKDFSSLVPSAFAKANAAFEAANTASGAAATSTPKVSSIVYPGDDTAANTDGGQTVTLNGAGFNAGASVLINGSYANVVSVANSTSLSFTTPSNGSGTYILYVINTDGGTGISVPGISYSGTPSWSNAAGSLATLYETSAVNNQLTATGDATITYSLQSGTLPPGSSLDSSTGLLSGTTQSTENSTTYNFTIRATDGQNQDTDRAFSITINPDVVTWFSPADGTVTALDENDAMASVTLIATSAIGESIAYTANALPTGVTISGSNVTGTPIGVGNTISVITATAANTNRTATRTFTWVVTLGSDLYFKNTTLILNGETTVTPFISDSSTNSLGLTIKGDTKPVLFNPYQGDGYYSNFFDGNGDYLSIPYSTSISQTGPYTLEFWFYPTYNYSGQYIFAQNGGGAFGLNWTGTVMKVDKNGVGVQITGTTTMGLNQWHHYAMTYDGTTTRVFANGTLDGSISSTGGLANVATTIGYYAALGSSSYRGYISNFRFVSGTALYTSSFTPSTTPLTAISGTSLLTCQSNRFIDNSTNNFTLTKAGDLSVSPNIPFTQNSNYSTYGSAYFDGTGDYLDSDISSAFTYGTGDFTIEFWAYLTALGGTPNLIDQRGGTQPSVRPTLFMSGSSLAYYTNGGVRISGPALATNVWYHIALSRNSGTTRLFVNGSQVGSSYTDGNNYTSTKVRIFSDDTGGTTSQAGYCSNLRILKGTGLYTSTFSPPTSPLTAIANTSLLTLQYNGGATNKGIIDNSNFNNIITRNGNTSQGTFSPYSVTGWSNYFDGSGDYLTAPSSAEFAFGTGDFTIEFWAYPTVNARQDWIDFDNGGGYRLLIYYDGTNIMYYSGSARITGSAMTLHTWQHIAVVRNSGSTKLYINGNQSGSTYTDSINFLAQPLTIGKDGAGSTVITGYMSNVRVVKGTAVYTSTFTPPTTPLTAISGTSLLTCQSNRFIDNSPNSFTLTRNGDVSVQALNPFGSAPEAVPISYSNYFDGTAARLTVGASSQFALGTQDFCIETWYFPVSRKKAYPRIFQSGLSSWATGDNWALLDRHANASTKFAWSCYNLGGNAILLQSTTTVSDNQWYHIAVTRSGSTFRMFINGVLEATYTNSGSCTTSATVGCLIGGTGAGDAESNGYISNTRYVIGSAVYTSTFTPSTTPLTAISGTSLLTCQSTKMIDNSTNAFTITAAGNTLPRIFNPFGYTAQSTKRYTPSLHGGSAYFDGTGDYLITPNIAFDLPTTTWCIEYWIYPTTIASGYYGLWGLSTSGFRQGIYTNSGTHYLSVLSGGGGYGGFSLVAANKVVVTGAWQHVALTSDGTTTRQFYNGVQTSTGPAASFSASTPTMGSWGAANYFTGYMSDFRITKGSAVYTSNFVPPAQASSNYSTNYPASLLLNFNNGGIIDQHGTNVLETVGNAQLSTAVKKYDSASMYFDGTGDYLKVPSSVAFAFGTGDFTWEAWVYFNSTGSRILDFNTSMLWLTSGTLQYYSGSGRITSDALTLGQWYHVALVRGSGVTKMYINGTQNGVNFTDSINYPTNALIIGADSGSFSQFMNGYIDDLRITKGYARYTSNFTPPTNTLLTK